MPSYDYHAFIDLSRRKPYICGVCRLDITHPIHQPKLPGSSPVFVAPDRDEREEEIETEPAPAAQMSLF